MRFLHLFVCFAMPFLGFSQSSDSSFFYTETASEIRFFGANQSNKMAFFIPKNKTIISIKNAKLIKKQQNLGSIDLKWQESNEKNYFFKNYIPNTQTLVVANKTDTIQLKILYIDTLEQDFFSLKYVLPFAETLPPNLYKKITWHIALQPDEAVFGGGEQFSFVNLSGQKLPFLVEEQGIGRGDMPISAIMNLRNAAGNNATTFMPMARFVSSEKRVFERLQGRFGYAFFDFSIKKECAWSEYIQRGASGFRVLRSKKGVWNIVTKQQPQPAFIFKTVLGLQGGTDTVLHKLALLEAAGVHPGAIWIQDWCGRRVTPFGKQLVWNWQLDRTRYPRFEPFRDSLAAKNIKLLGYMNPFLAENTDLAQTAQEIDVFTKADSNRILLQKGSENAAFLQTATGFKVHFLNLKTRNIWIEDIAQSELIGNRFSGWMADFGEWFPLNGGNKSSKNADFEAHNNYPNRWAQTQTNIQNKYIEERGDTLAIFMRSASEPTGHLYWAGDQNTNWGKNDGFPSLVPALLSSGLSGVGINHGDIGGFTSFKKGVFSMTRNRELLYRWIELCAFTPVFRTHEGLAPDFNLQIYSDTSAARFFSKFSAVHDALYPYLMQTYNEIYTQHLPMIRHLVLEFPDDPNVRDLSYQYMLGSRFLVIPVLKKGAKTVRAYLPKGSWQHFFTKKTTVSKGEWLIFDAPLGQPAVFERL